MSSLTTGQQPHKANLVLYISSFFHKHNILAQMSNKFLFICLLGALDNVQLQESRRLAKVKADAILTAPCEASVLYPEDGGNMHCFTAQNACAVLDVLGPPYDDSSGRHCHFYSASPPSVGNLSPT
jgi:hypothetical protein